MTMLFGLRFDFRNPDFAGTTAAERQRVTEVVTTLKAASTREPFEFRGRTVTVTPGPCRPGAPAIMMGGDSEVLPACGERRLAGTGPRLVKPLAERMGARIVEPGAAQVPRRADGLNASGAIQGGLIALAAEEAARSLAPEPSVLHALNLRYLRPFASGPAHAVAAGDGAFTVVRITDAGAGKLAAVATTRLGDPERR